MPTCPAGKTTFTDQELDAAYAGDSILVGANFTYTADGLIEPTSMNSYLDYMTNTKNRIPRPPPLAETINTNFDPVAQYVEKQRNFLADVNAEFCDYDAKYQFALDKFMDAVVNGSTSSAQTSGDVRKYLNYAHVYNKKLNDIIQIVQALNQNKYDTSRAMDADAQSLNRQLTERYAKIKAEMAFLKENASEEDVRRRMVKYTQEKGRATDNLLSLYTFLNVVALGVLIYVYKS
jgi:hypothetical protein